MPRKSVITVDAENNRETGEFTCGSWYDGKKLRGTHDLTTYAREVGKFPPNTTLRGHNVNYDIKKMLEWGVPLPKDLSTEDSLIGVRFLEPFLPEKKLDQVAKLEGYVYRDVHGESDPNSNLRGCGGSSFTTHNLCDIYNNRAAERGQGDHLHLYQRINRAFLGVEVSGLKTNVRRLRQTSKELESRLAELHRSIDDDRMVTNDHVFRKWLTDNWPAEQIKLLPKSYNTKEAGIGKEYLKLLNPQTQELLDITEARELSRFKKVFIDNVIQATNSVGFIFPSYKLLVARTQRRSSEPNIQNWPDKARRNVVSRFQGGKIVTLDFSNLEARIFAWQAGCKDFLNALVRGGYVAVASECLGITIKDKKDPRYKQVKSTVLAVTYNMSPGLFAFREFVASGGKKRMSKAEAQEHYDVLFNRYPEIYDEMEKRKKHAWKYGRLIEGGLIGMDTPLPIIPDDLLPDDEDWVRRYRKKVENWATNHPTQRFAGWVTGLALADLQDFLADSFGGWGPYLEALWESSHSKVINDGLYYIPINEIHDAIGSDARKDSVKEAEETMHYFMTAGESLKKVAPKFDTSILGTEAKIGDSWDEESE